MTESHSLQRLPCRLFVVGFILVAASASSTVPPTTPDQPSAGWDEVLKDELLKTQRNTVKAIRKAFTQSDCNNVFGATIAQQSLELATLQAKVFSLQTELNSTRDQLDSARQELHTATSQLASDIFQLRERVEGQLGSVFIRWGRSRCTNESTLIYHGQAGGKAYSEKGGGTNLLCLSKSPQHDGTSSTGTLYSNLHAAEYQGIKSKADLGVPCAVCRAFQATTVMVPATLTCPTGWKTQYKGRLASQYVNYYATEYVCLDSSPESDADAVKNHNKNLLFYVVADCASLRCPKFSRNKVVTCVVCSK